MSQYEIPAPPPNSFRLTLNLREAKPRLDAVLLEALRSQTDRPGLQTMSRTTLKDLFKKKRVRIKGQAALPSSALAAGTTYVDLLAV